MAQKHYNKKGWMCENRGDEVSISLSDNALLSVIMRLTIVSEVTLRSGKACTVNPYLSNTINLTQNSSTFSIVQTCDT